MAIPSVPFTGIVQTTPDPYMGNSQWRIWRNPAKGRIEIQVTRNGGATWKTIVPEPPTNAAAGLTLSLTESGDAEWVMPSVSSSSTTGASSASLVASSSLVYAELTMAGELRADRTFGFYMAPSNSPIRCFGTQMWLQSPGVGGDTKVDIVSEAGFEMERFSILSAGITFRQTLFSTPLTMPAGSLWRARLKTVAPDDPGSFLSVRLLLAA